MSYAFVAADATPTTTTACTGCAQADFEHHLKKPGIHLFTASWCGHCVQMKEGFADRDLEKPYPYYEHEESTVDQKKLQKSIFDVNGFPTIYFVKKGPVIKKHEGGRTKKEIDEAYETFLKE